MLNDDSIHGEKTDTPPVYICCGSDRSKHASQLRPFIARRTGRPTYLHAGHICNADSAYLQCMQDISAYLLNISACTSQSLSVGGRSLFLEVASKSELSTLVRGGPVQSMSVIVTCWPSLNSCLVAILLYILLWERSNSTTCIPAA